MTSLTRRSLLFGGSLVGAHGLLAQVSSLPRAAGSNLQRVGVASWPFHARIIAPKNDMRDATLPGFDLIGFAKFIHSEFAVPGIEPLDQHFASLDAAFLREFHHTLNSLGMRVINIPVDEPVDLGSTDPAVRNHGYAVYRQWIDIAVLLGSPSIRIAVPKCGGPFDVSGPVRALIPVADYGASRNIMVHLENDDPVLANAEHIVAILRLANNPNLRALPDFGNGLMAGDSAFAVNAARRMFQFPGRIAHVKDAERINGKRPTVPLPELFAIARQAHFTGAFSMESDSDVDPIADTKHLIQQTLRLM